MIKIRRSSYINSIKSKKYKCAIIGIGHWGKNYIRVLNEIGNIEIKYLCDKNPKLFKKYIKKYKCTENIQTVLDDSEIDFVVISTIASSHYEILKLFITSGKDVLIEKPVAISRRDVSYLKKIKSDSIIFTGFTFIYNPAIIKIKKLIDENVIGEIYYINCFRTHLGLIRNDVSVVWDLAPHDISILMYLLDHKKPKLVKLNESNPLKSNKSDYAYLSLDYGKINSLIHVSWIDCSKERKVIIVGSRGKIIFDDINNFEKIKIIKKGVSSSVSEDNYGEFQLNLRNGGITSPKISPKEPLKEMCKEFINCINLRKQPYTDLNFGIKVSEVILNAKKN